MKKATHLHPKDEDRFWKYLEVLQERVPWKDKILLRISGYLYIVAKEGGGRVVKCDCGHEFGDYRINWKLSCRIRVRRTVEEMSEVVPVGYPPIFEMLPDLYTFYRDWLGQPLPESPDWFQDKTLDTPAQWAKEA